MKSSDRVQSSDSLSSTASSSSTDTINNFCVFDPLASEKSYNPESVTWSSEETGIGLLLSSVKTTTFLNPINVKHMVNEAANKFISPLIVLTLDELQAITEEIFSADPEVNLNEAIAAGEAWISDLKNTVSIINAERKKDNKPSLSYKIVRWEAFTKLPKFEETLNFITAVLYPDKASDLLNNLFPTKLDDTEREKLIVSFKNAAKYSEVRKFISNTVTIFIKKSINRLLKNYIEREHANIYFLAEDGMSIKLLSNGENIFIAHANDELELWNRDKYPIQPEARAKCKIRLSSNGFPILATKNGTPILVDDTGFPVSERMRIQTLMIDYLIKEFTAFILLGNFRSVNQLSKELLGIQEPITVFPNVDVIKPIMSYPISASQTPEGSNAINTFSAFFKTLEIYNQFAPQLSLPENSKLTVVDSLVPNDTKAKKRANNGLAKSDKITKQTNNDAVHNTTSISQQSFTPRRSSSLPPTTTRHNFTTVASPSKTDDASSTNLPRTNSFGSVNSSPFAIPKKSPQDSSTRDKRTVGLAQVHKSLLFPPHASGQNASTTHNPIDEIVAKLISVLTSPIRTKHINYNNGVRGKITILNRQSIDSKKVIGKKRTVDDEKNEQRTLSDYLQNIMLSAVDSDSGEINVTVEFEWRDETIEIQAIFPLDVLTSRHQPQDRRHMSTYK